MTIPAHFMDRLLDASKHYSIETIPKLSQIFQEQDFQAGASFGYQLGLEEGKKHLLFGMTVSEIGEMRHRVDAQKKLLDEVQNTLEKLHEKVGSCPYSNTDRWGHVMELFYRQTGLSLEKLKAHRAKPTEQEGE